MRKRNPSGLPEFSERNKVLCNYVWFLLIENMEGLHFQDIEALVEPVLGSADSAEKRVRLTDAMKELESEGVAGLLAEKSLYILTSGGFRKYASHEYRSGAEIHVKKDPDFAARYTSVRLQRFREQIHGIMLDTMVYCDSPGRKLGEVGLGNLEIALDMAKVISEEAAATQKVIEGILKNYVRAEKQLP